MYMYVLQLHNLLLIDPGEHEDVTPLSSDRSAWTLPAGRLFPAVGTPFRFVPVTIIPTHNVHVPLHFKIVHVAFKARQTEFAVCCHRPMDFQISSKYFIFQIVYSNYMAPWPHPLECCN